LLYLPLSTVNLQKYGAAEKVSLLKNENDIFEINSEPGFEALALEIFNLQYGQNKVYRQWVDLLKVPPCAVHSSNDIPFLPVEFFKNHDIVTGTLPEQVTCFTSSATTSSVPAKHLVKDLPLYERSFEKAFSLFYGNVADYCILALLPNYLERQGSSLVYMCNKLIQDTGHPLSGFYLKNIDELIATIGNLKKSKQKTLLIGVSYALMDLADKGVKLDGNFTVMETGGMKGTRKEMLKPELHKYLKNGFGIPGVHSEYGMTELLSQAYSTGSGTFTAPPWMKFLIREVDDPLKLRSDGRTGGINVIDLANIHSCSFIATKDLGRLNDKGELELMGRYDQSDVRGCNLMLGNF
jgi:phenylacetate-coenzyme A ligase PaaK-like adenylate-forming protein